MLADEGFSAWQRRRVIVVGDAAANDHRRSFAGERHHVATREANSITLPIIGAIELAQDGRDFIDGGLGNDDVIINGSGIVENFVDGGDGTLDRFVVNGGASAETFVVYAAADAMAAGFTNLKPGTEIVITRNGQVITELDNVEEIMINTGDGTDTVTPSATSRRRASASTPSRSTAAPATTRSTSRRSSRRTASSSAPTAATTRSSATCARRT